MILFKKAIIGFTTIAILIVMFLIWLFEFYPRRFEDKEYVTDDGLTEKFAEAKARGEFI